jgi:hypothetical protein
LQGIRQFHAAGIKNGDMVKAGGTGWRGRTARAFPGVQPNVMMVTAGGKEGGLLSETLREFKAQDVAIESERAVEVGHLQVNVADSHLRVQLAGVCGRFYIHGFGSA